MANCPKCNETGYISLSPCLACGYLSKYAKAKGQKSSLDIPDETITPLSDLSKGAEDNPLPFTSDINEPNTPGDPGGILGEVTKDLIDELEKELSEESSNPKPEILSEETEEEISFELEDDDLLLAYKQTEGLTKEKLSEWFNKDMFYSDTLVRNEEDKKDASSFILLIKSISLIVGAFLVNVFFIYYF